MQSNLNHLLILTPGFPENESDTLCTPWLQVYIKNLAKLNPGLKITVIAVGYPYESKKYEWHGIEINALGIRHTKILGHGKTILKILINSLLLNKKKPVDILHSFFFPLAMYGNLVSRVLGIPHVHTIIGRDGATKSKISRLINLSGLHLVTLSEFHNESFLKAFKRNSDSIIPFGLDTSDFPEMQANKRTIDILGAGSLYPVKNFSLFIEVIIRLLREYPDLQISIIGGGIEKEMLQKKIDAAGVGGNIFLTDSLPREKVLMKMQQSRIFLHTSGYESQGYVFYEALYAGCHLVSFDVGVAEASAKWNICSSEDEMFETLKELVNHKIENTREVPFTAGETVAGYMKIYLSLIAKKR